METEKTKHYIYSGSGSRRLLGLCLRPSLCERHIWLMRMRTLLWVVSQSNRVADGWFDFIIWINCNIWSQSVGKVCSRRPRHHRVQNDHQFGLNKFFPLPELPTEMNGNCACVCCVFGQRLCACRAQFCGSNAKCVFRPLHAEQRPKQPNWMKNQS